MIPRSKQDHSHWIAVTGALVLAVSQREPTGLGDIFKDLTGFMQIDGDAMLLIAIRRGRHESAGWLYLHDRILLPPVVSSSTNTGVVR